MGKKPRRSHVEIRKEHVEASRQILERTKEEIAEAKAHVAQSKETMAESRELLKRPHGPFSWERVREVAPGQLKDQPEDKREPAASMGKSDTRAGRKTGSSRQRKR